MNLVELQNKIHAQNKELGWWDEPRPFSTFACLFHSELSEAMEGDRKGLMDDHLPNYEMFWVELGDFAIRVLDYLGSKSFTWPVGVFCTGNYNKIDDLCFLHRLISGSTSHNDGDARNFDLSNSVRLCFAMADLHKVDLHQIILEKVEYNKHRADHKRENRAKKGGKKY
jgi:hypothetical protein